jgi:hypothetical protein
MIEDLNGPMGRPTPQAGEKRHIRYEDRNDGVKLSFMNIYADVPDGRRVKAYLFPYRDQAEIVRGHRCVGLAIIRPK